MLIVGLAYLMNYSGLTATLGLLALGMPACKLGGAEAPFRCRLIIMGGVVFGRAIGAVF